MIEEFPPKIQAALDEAMPLDFRLWWVRGIVLEVQEVEHPSGDEKLRHLRDLVLKVGDVDDLNDGYEIRLEGNYHNIELNDAVSLLGHERYNAERVGYPRLIINHNTQRFHRIYAPAAFLRFGVVPAVEYKYWLACWRPKDMATHRNRFILFPLIGLALAWYNLDPSVLMFLGAFLGGFLFLLAPALILISGIRWLAHLLFGQPRFSFEPKYEPLLAMQNYRDFMHFKRQDLTPLYEKLAHLVDAEVQASPAPELEFMPIHRGSHTVGRLTPKQLPTIAEVLTEGASPDARPVPVSTA